YFGDVDAAEGSVGRAGGLKKLVGANLEEIDAREVNSLPIAKSADGRQIFVRVGRYGPYLERVSPDGEGTERANLPEELAPDEVTAASVEELFAKSEVSDRVLGDAPDTGYPVVVKDGRYGPYVTEVLPEDAPTKGKAAVKARTASLFKTMTVETVSYEDALRLLTLPRVVGADPETGVEITAQNGRYGPYLKKGTDSRSLAGEEELFTVTLDQAQAIYALPKQRGRSATAAPPLREVGEDPETKKPMVIKEGRFGPYVTDGETNASLRKGDEVETLTVDRAGELLAERRARGPAPKKAPTRKPAATKTPKAPKATTAKTVKAGTSAAAKTAGKPAAAKTASRTATR
ncbi:MAG: topoisomerase C-terminal repeat-containing protein, partial [Nakamurella sp.]